MPLNLQILLFIFAIVCPAEPAVVLILRNYTFISTSKAASISTMKQNIITCTNCLRSCHQVNSLTRDSQLDSDAQDWANKLTSNNAFQHSDMNHGENLFYAPQSYVNSGSESVSAWYSESKGYNYNVEPSSSDISKYGHFTQLVWAGTTLCGVGISQYSDGSYVVVGEYDSTPGNYIGKFKKNVLSPTCSDPWNTCSSNNYCF